MSDSPGTRQVLIVPDAGSLMYVFPHSPEKPMPMKTSARPQMIWSAFSATVASPKTRLKTPPTPAAKSSARIGFPVR